MLPCVDVLDLGHSCTSNRLLKVASVKLRPQPLPEPLSMATVRGSQGIELDVKAPRSPYYWKN